MVIDLVSDSDEEREPSGKPAPPCGTGGGDAHSESALETLVAMGFARVQARAALEQVRLRACPRDARACTRVLARQAAPLPPHSGWQSRQ